MTTKARAFLCLVKIAASRSALLAMTKEARFAPIGGSVTTLMIGIFRFFRRVERVGLKIIENGKKMICLKPPFRGKIIRIDRKPFETMGDCNETF
jgi:hypothetical protein